MITCSRFLEFDAAHRVMNHESKCRTLHGHRYKVEIVATSGGNSLDDIGRVIDFGVIKEKVGGWIDAHWDHTSILYHEDPLVELIMKDPSAYREPFLALWNPTAENMAKYLLKQSQHLIGGDGLKVVKVVVWETPNCKAECS